jgi:D-proline reductase (dithiol) PrdB
LAGIVVELSDADIRAQVAAAPVLEFPEPAYTAARPLAKATIAIVTTAGIHRRGDEMFSGMGDQSFRVIDASERDLLSSHMSPNFDLSGFAADLNVVYPIDRLRELQAEGVVGALSPVNLSFMGAQGWSPTMETIVLDTGPAAAQRLLSAGVDTVLLTPV